MPLELLTRISVLIPFPATYVQFLLVDQIITNFEQTFGGITYSDNIIIPTFQGQWYDRATKRTDYDQHTLVWSDARIPISDAVLQDYLDRLKQQTQFDFNQKIVWITLHEVHRVTTHDPP